MFLLAADEKCPAPDGYALNRGKAYKIHASTGTWSDALDACGQEGARPPIMESQEDADAIMDKMGANATNSTYST